MKIGHVVTQTGQFAKKKWLVETRTSQFAGHHQYPEAQRKAVGVEDGGLDLLETLPFIRHGVGSGGGNVEKVEEGDDNDEDRYTLL